MRNIIKTFLLTFSLLVGCADKSPIVSTINIKDAKTQLVTAGGDITVKAQKIQSDTTYIQKNIVTTQPSILNNLADIQGNAGGIISEVKNVGKIVLPSLDNTSKQLQTLQTQNDKLKKEISDENLSKIHSLLYLIFALSFLGTAAGLVLYFWASLKSGLTIAIISAGTCALSLFLDIYLKPVLIIGGILFLIGLGWLIYEALKSPKIAAFFTNLFSKTNTITPTSKT